MNELELLITARDEATAVLNRLNGSISRTNAQLRQTGNASQGLNQAATGLRRFVAAAAGIAAASIGVGSFVSNASSVEDAVTGVVRTTDLAGPALQRFTDNIAEVSERIPRARTELLGFAEVAGQLGVRGADNLSNFAETIARLADSTNIVGEQGALQLAQLINVTNEDFGNIDRIGSAVAALGNSSATTEAQLVRTAREIANSTAAFGTSAQDVLGLGAAVASLGQAPQLAASSVARTIREIQTAVATGSPELESFAELAGQSVEAFTDSFNADNLGGFLDVVEGLGQTDAAEGVLVMQELGLNGDELNRVLPLLGANIEFVRETIALSNTAYDENIALVNESERRYRTFTSQVRFLQNEIGVLSATAGTEFLEELATSAQNFTEILRGDTIRDAFAGIGRNISSILAAFNEEGTQAITTIELIALQAEDISGLVSMAVVAMNGLAESAGDFQIELNPVRGLMLGIAAVVFGVRNAFRQIPDFIIIFSARLEQALQNARVDVNDFLANLPDFLGGQVSQNTADTARARSAQLEVILNAARENLQANQVQAEAEIDALARRFSGLDAADAMVARAERNAEASIERSRLGRLLAARVEAVQNEALSLVDFNAELEATLANLNSVEQGPEGEAVRAPTEISDLLRAGNGVGLDTAEIEALFDEAREQIALSTEETVRVATEGAAETAMAAAEAQAEAIALTLTQAEIAVQEGLSEIERQFEDGNLSITQFYEERARLTREGIDAQIEAQRAEGGEGSQGAILELQSQRRDVAIETAREIAAAEEQLAEVLQRVGNELTELTGGTLSAEEQTEQIRQSYAELLEDLEAEGDTAGISLVNNLINVRAARARFEELEAEAQASQERLRNQISEIQDSDAPDVERQAAANRVQAEADAEQARFAPELEDLANQIGDDELLQRVNALRDGFQNLGDTAFVSFSSVGEIIESQLNDGINGIIEGTTTISEAFRSMASSAVAEIRRIIVQLLIQQAIQAALSAFGVPPGAAGAAAGAAGGGGGGGGGIVGSLLSGIQGNADGGLIRGAGTGTSDSILRRLSNGEFVIRAAAVQHYGAELFEGLNRMLVSPGAIPAPVVRVIAPDTTNMNQGGLVNTPQAAANNVRIVNVAGDDMFEGFLNSRNGERLIMNIISRNN